MDKINVLDCSGILGSVEKLRKEDFANFGEKLGTALSKVGYAYLTNHGLDLGKVERVYEVSKDFFDMPKEIKNKMRKPPGAASFHGYAGPGDELLNATAPNAANELRQFYDVTGHIESNDICYFPSEVPGFKDAFDEFRQESVNLSDKLLRCISLYLGLKEDELVKRHTHMKDRSVPTQTVIRSSMYSPLETMKNDVRIPEGEEADIRCGEHCDWHTITLLFQDLVGGLDIRTVSGEWVAATPIENSILLITGDLMEIYSGGRLPATPHRVRIVDDTKLDKKPRQSLLYAPSPDGNEEVAPLVPILEELTEKKRTIYGPQSYERVNAHEWVHKRHATAASY
ncbi:hypothetical protein Ocin01_16398 [Orchesella cincta]|uniref:Fe2OG dioxygenase domain-containing protein n=1 Tax=Orchesella cincta TaxID=48709 RepID=A0A1D2MBJ6_ORCCI|nr:hypothetical protein Ocin01_16398 [Orchesella cincta]